ncbi:MULTISPECIES: Rnf-Nqr domain containing protein [Pseudomonas]|uniref:Rnf-Nqr domain containing protein n=1 Tax=Pseudomonas TaxID=286 RepID=UPI001F51A9C4|nr:Rnf-Nqr domain containing protein [Pseudomonas putida]MCI0912941.1 electron transporter RnfA [Pseudomonas putida]
MNDYVLMLISAALVSHLFLRRQPASRLRVHVCGLACALSIMLAVTGGQLLEHLIVAPWQLQHLRLFLLLPWQALLAWGIPQTLARLRPQWPTQGLAWPLLGNAVVLGMALQVIGEQREWQATLSWAVLAGLGFWLALALFDDLNQRSEHAQVPEALRGLPIALLGAGVMGMALSGLNGMFTQ